MGENILSAFWDGSKEFIARIDEMQKQADEAAKEIVVKSAGVLIAKAQSNFEGAHPAGQPHTGGDKPNVVTGDARRSITMDPPKKDGIAEYSTHVGPRVAYARRLDKGFTGSDSLGRNYNQQAYPYFTPAVEVSQPLFAEIAADTWKHYLKL